MRAEAAGYGWMRTRTRLDAERLDARRRLDAGGCGRAAGWLL